MRLCAKPGSDGENPHTAWASHQLSSLTPDCSKQLTPCGVGWCLSSVVSRAGDHRGSPVGPIEDPYPALPPLGVSPLLTLCVTCVKACLPGGNWSSQPVSIVHPAATCSSCRPRTAAQMRRGGGEMGREGDRISRSLTEEGHRHRGKASCRDAGAGKARTTLLPCRTLSGGTGVSGRGGNPTATLRLSGGHRRRWKAAGISSGEGGGAMG